MNSISEHDACPNCWHNPTIIGGPDGIGTFSIGNLITFRGGTLDKTYTCTQCKWNFFQVFECKSCKPSRPCPAHYAAGYNGAFHAHISLFWHRMYMRNSPYNKNWLNRPACIGAWYASQVEKYEDVISTIRRFTSEINAIRSLNQLENDLKYTYKRYTVFWSQFYNICVQHFSGNDAISQAVKSYYQTLRTNHFHVY